MSSTTSSRLSFRAPGVLPWVVALAILFAACGAPEEDAPDPGEPSADVTLTPEQVEGAGIEVQAVALTPISEPMRVSGTVTPPDTSQAALGSFVEGRIARVHVIPGDAVTVGQALVEIHSHELIDALRDLRAAEANLALAEGAVERSRELLEAGAISQREADRRSAELEAARADAERAREWVEHLNPSEDGNVVVAAPMAGQVFEVNVGPGEAVVPGSPLVRLGSTRVLWVRAFIPAEQARSVTPGTDAHVHFGAEGQGPDVDARLIRVGGAVDPTRNAVDVRFELLETLPGIRPGQFAQVDMAVGDPRPMAVVPSDAVQRIGGETVVFLEVEPGRYEPVSVVAIPLPTGEMAVEGVAEGDRVVVAGAYSLRSAFEMARSPGEDPQ